MIALGRIRLRNIGNPGLDVVADVVVDVADAVVGTAVDAVVAVDVVADVDGGDLTSPPRSRLIRIVNPSRKIKSVTSFVLLILEIGP